MREIGEKGERAREKRLAGSIFKPIRVIASKENDKLADILV